MLKKKCFDGGLMLYSPSEGLNVWSAVCVAFFTALSNPHELGIMQITPSTDSVDVFTLLPHLHNFFSESGGKTAQTAHAHKRRHQWARYTLIEFPPPSCTWRNKDCFRTDHYYVGLQQQSASGSAYAHNDFIGFLHLHTIIRCSQPLKGAGIKTTCKTDEQSTPIRTSRREIISQSPALRMWRRCLLIKDNLSKADEINTLP